MTIKDFTADLAAFDGSHLLDGCFATYEISRCGLCANGVPVDAQRQEVQRVKVGHVGEK